MSKILEFVKKKLHSDRFVSLNLKLTIVILLAAGLTVAVLGACSLLQTVVTKNVFQADFMKKKFVDRRYEELKTYIRDNGVKSTDKELLEEWMDDKKYTELIVYNSKGQVFSGGWIVDSDGTVSGDGVNLGGKQNEDTRSAQPRIENKPKIDTQHFTRDTFNRIIRFRDNSCYVYMNVYYEQAWIRFILIVSIILAVLTFFLVILKYNKAVLRRAFDIAADVKRISDGDMDSQVTVGPHDELGELAEKELEIFPENGVYTKYRGDCVFEKDMWKALEIYGEALDCTANGLIMLDITDRVSRNREQLIGDVKRSGDIGRASLLRKLSPGDPTLARVCDELLMQQKNADPEELEGRIKEELESFDRDPEILQALKALYRTFGISEKLAELKVRLVITEEIDAFKEIREEVREILSREPDVHGYIILRDVDNYLGLISEAKEAQEKADTMKGGLDR